MPGREGATSEGDAADAGMLGDGWMGGGKLRLAEGGGKQGGGGRGAPLGCSGRRAVSW